MIQKYDAVVIGAGMSGMAAAIRLGMFDKKVLLVEKHNICGGLNSYYQRRNFNEGGIRKFDVGLHALTNFIRKGEKRKPFSKLLKQLRLRYDDFKLHEQSYSVIDFASEKIKFSNDFDLMKSEIYVKFPAEKDNFEKLLKYIVEFNEVNLDQKYESSRDVLKKYLSNNLLIEMILCPLLIYGSAWEHDMDFSQFVIMFKSIYLEGFSRPEGGVRTITKLLEDKMKDVGVEVSYKESVEELIISDNKVSIIKTSKREIEAKYIFSSMGLPETYDLAAESRGSGVVGAMTFLETLFVYDRKPELTEFDPTIVFYNNSDTYHYQKAQELFDSSSAVVCCPDNYEAHQRDGEGMFRITYMANYDKWNNLSKEEYKTQKSLVADEARKLMNRIAPEFGGELRFTDVFSPTTIKKYTSHLGGTVYGSTEKSRDGKTKYSNLFVIGTDQGFLGIVGAMLSGISISNLYGLMEQS